MIQASRKLLPAAALAIAAANPLHGAELAIIIDDLGYAVDQAHEVAALPGPLAVAVLPDAPRAARAAEIAHASGKEVLLHLPLQAVGQTTATELTVTLDTSERAMAAMIDEALTRVPHVSGINSHMGSLITRHPGHMSWLMRSLKRYPKLYFIDSYTTERSVALAAAAEAGLPALRRHVFLDADTSVAAIRKEFERALALARRDGYAIAIGHPHPTTLTVLAEAIPSIGTANVRLVALNDLVRRYGLPDPAVGQ
ncbi:MAG: divergent polysaccharide deacetylase family protein [Pseudomonadota bacterium]